MAFHQIHNSIGNEIYNGILYRDLHYESHLHRSFELVTVLRGELRAVADGCEYRLFSGESLFFPPFTVHELHSVGEAEIFIAVFSGGYVGRVARIFDGKHAARHSFRLSDVTEALLCRYLCSEPAQIMQPMPDALMLRACLYAVCSEFLAQCELTENKRETSLLLKLLLYIDAHFREEITLASLSERFGYHSDYISRVLNAGLGVGLKALLSGYRVEAAAEALRESDASILEIALASGFGSLRSFNRVFHAELGISPSEYRKKAIGREN